MTTSEFKAVEVRSVTPISNSKVFVTYKDIVQLSEVMLICGRPVCNETSRVIKDLTRLDGSMEIHVGFQDEVVLDYFCQLQSVIAGESHKLLWKGRDTLKVGDAASYSFKVQYVVALNNWNLIRICSELLPLLMRTVEEKGSIEICSGLRIPSTTEKENANQ